MPHKSGTEFRARLGEAEAPDQVIAVLGREIGIGPAQQIEPEERIADRARNPYEIARLGAAAPNFLTRRDLADRGQRQDGRAAGADRIAAQQVDAVAALIFAETLGKAGEPFRPELGREGRRKDVMKRPRPHRREIRQVDAQQLARDQVRRVLRQIMHSGDDRVRGYDETLPRARNRRGRRRRPARARPALRAARKNAGSARILRARLQPSAATSRQRRKVRPSLSRTPFASPGSLPEKKA